MQKIFSNKLCMCVCVCVYVCVCVHKNYVRGYISLSI